MCGTNTGDLAAGPLGLGHVRGMLPLAGIFLAVVWAEKLVDWTTVAFYWLAIIVLRTMATNIADLATHDLKLSYPVFLLILIAFMAAMLWADRFRLNEKAHRAGARARLPTTDWSYWVVMLAAGVFGTALGDWLADEVGLGVYWASVVGMPLFAAAVWAAYRFDLSKPWYWIAIATCRTWGTDLGDMLARLFRLSGTSRAVALWSSTAITAALLAGIVYFWTHRSPTVATAAAPETSG
jgi:uncharacterized membrane-anchored protein